MSQIFVPMTVATVGAVPEAIVPAASAFTNLARQLGGSISTALLVTIAQRSATSDYASLAQSIRLDRPGVAQYVAQQGGPHAAGLVANLFGMLETQSTVLGYAEAALITAVVSLLLAPLALMMRGAHGQESGAPQHIEIA
jgi:DHA2 family multidrug resistance protein